MSDNVGLTRMRHSQSSITPIGRSTATARGSRRYSTALDVEDLRHVPVARAGGGPTERGAWSLLALVFRRVGPRRAERGQPPQHREICDAQNDGDVVLAIRDGRADSGGVPDARGRGSAADGAVRFQDGP